MEEIDFIQSFYTQKMAALVYNLTRGCIVYANQYFYKLTNYFVSDILNDPQFPFSDRIKGICLGGADEDSTLQQEAVLRVITKEGETLVLPAIYRKVKINSSDLLFVSFKSPEFSSTRLNAQIYNSLLDSIPFTMLVVDQNGEVKYVNRYGSEFLGKDKMSVLGLLSGKAINCVHSTHGAGCGKNEECNVCPIRTRFEKTAQIGESFYNDEDTITLQNNGENVIIHILISSTRLSYEDENLVLLTIIDITQKKQNEQELQRKTNLLEELLDNIPDIIYFKDKDARFVEVSLSKAQEVGYNNRADLYGKSDFDFFEPNLAKNKFDRDIAVINMKEKISWFEEEAQRQNGERYWIDTIKLPWFDKEGNLLGLFGISRDITEKKRIQFQLQETNRLLTESIEVKDRYFSIISHDLKTPIGTMVELLNFLNEHFQESSEEENLEIIRTVHRDLSAIYSTFTNLLEWSRKEMGKIPFSPKNIRFIDIIPDAISLHNKNIADKNIDISWDIPKDLNVFADYDMLQTILRNLISNAIKFTHKSGEIIIGSKPVEENYVTLFVRDNGVGISEKIHSAIFDGIPELSTYGTGNEKGTGLGLELCKNFVERHGGTIRVRSKPGLGSTFYFSLPVTDISH